MHKAHLTHLFLSSCPLPTFESLVLCVHTQAHTLLCYLPAYLLLSRHTFTSAWPVLSSLSLSLSLLPSLFGFARNVMNTHCDVSKFSKIMSALILYDVTKCNLHIQAHVSFTAVSISILCYNLSQVPTKSLERIAMYIVSQDSKLQDLLSVNSCCTISAIYRMESTTRSYTWPASCMTLWRAHTTTRLRARNHDHESHFRFDIKSEVLV